VQRLTTSRHSQSQLDWSSDGRFLLFTEQSNEMGSATGTDLAFLPVTEQREPTRFVQSRFQESNARFSPDGKWVSFTSDESGRNEIYVVAFPSGGGKRRISRQGGDLSLWNKDGKELYYRSPDGLLMSVAVKAEAHTLEFGAAVPLFPIAAPFDIAPDGQRFLTLVPLNQSEASQLIVVTNWQLTIGRNNQ
jgi:Tol biopolymer transport system component